MVRFIHTADIHLDSPLRGLERYEGAPRLLRSATRQAFDNLIKLAVDQGVDFVLIAGDLYDGDWLDYNTGLYFVRQMNVLREAGISVFLVRGNHDAASQIAKSLTLPDNVREFSCQGPETVILDSLGVALHGQGYLQRQETSNLARNYPDPVPGLVNIGLLHTALDGREGHEPYAPCSVDELVNKGYDYWALGHVHSREFVHREPWIVYPGSLQGRHVRETGAKGCTVVSLDHGQVYSVEEVDLDVLRWCRCLIDCSQASSLEEVLDKVQSHVQQELEAAAGRLIALRLELGGISPADGALRRDPERLQAEIRAVVQATAGDYAWVEKIKVRTTGVRRQPVQEHLPSGFLQKLFAELPHDETLLELVNQYFQELKAKLPSELFAQYRELNMEDPQARQELLEQAISLAELALGPKEAVG